MTQCTVCWNIGPQFPHVNHMKFLRIKSSVKSYSHSCCSLHWNKILSLELLSAQNSNTLNSYVVFSEKTDPFVPFLEPIWSLHVENKRVCWDSQEVSSLLKKKYCGSTGQLDSRASAPAIQLFGRAHDCAARLAATPVSCGRLGPERRVEPGQILTPSPAWVTLIWPLKIALQILAAK